MPYNMNLLGCNSGHLSPQAIKDLGYGMIETSLGKQQAYDQMVEKNLSDLHQAMAIGMAYTIHLPVYLPPVWLGAHDFYDGFYLDPKAEMRALSFEVLEDNLKKLSSTFSPVYYVVHFPGIYPAETVYEEDFSTILHNSLSKMNDLANTYNVKLALEYFGTNYRFSHYKDWITALSAYNALEPLLDTGHLYFNCFRNGFDYDEVLKGLAPHCIGFHLWNVCGEGFYDQSEYYKKYHHIVPHLSQKRSEGWAFEPETVLPYLAQFGKPLLVESGQRFKGESYFVEGLKWIEELLRNQP